MIYVGPYKYFVLTLHYIANDISLEECSLDNPPGASVLGIFLK